jgi:hypothetical protein
LETYRAEVTEGGRMDDKMEDLFAQLTGPGAKGITTVIALFLNLFKNYILMFFLL